MPSEDEDAERIVRQIRADGTLVPELSPEETYSILAEWLGKSVFAYTGFIGDEIACMYGLCADSVLSERAYLWLLTTNRVDEYPLVFARHSQIELQRVLDKFPEIIGIVDKEFSRSVRWLKWLGAEFTGTSKMHNKTVRTFRIRRH